MPPLEMICQPPCWHHTKFGQESSTMLSNCFRVFALLIPLLCLTTAPAKEEEPTKPITIDTAVVHRFIISLMELREGTQPKHLSEEEIKAVARIFASAKFEKKFTALNVERTIYISRFEIYHGYLGGTPNSGKTQSGMLTMDARTIYWNGSIYTLPASEASKLLAIFPKPVNPRTISERPEVKSEDKMTAQDPDGNPH
ncbi:MAG: hypothetical protein V4675_23125 [Verrucomicrobiota bacterium]